MKPETSVTYYIMTEKGDYVPSVGSRKLRLMNYFYDTQLKYSIKKFEDKDKIEIQKINLSLTAFELKSKDYEFVGKALDDFIALMDISINSPFKILGHFSILELLLTYRNNTSHEDSIYRQLQRKVSLLNNQFENKINFQKYFKGANSNTIETIIGKLYKYRNNIAHGNNSDFKNELKLLKDKKNNILAFLRVLLKKILVYSIKNPRLIKDLKYS